METGTKEEPLAFSEKCRLCLCNAGAVNLFKSLCLVEDIFLCTGVTIYNSDKLPQKICFKCCEIVANAKELRHQVTANEALLDSLFEDCDKTESPRHLKETQMKNESHTSPVDKTETDSTDTDVNSSPEGSSSKKRKTVLRNMDQGRTKNTPDSIEKFSKNKSPISETNCECINENRIQVRKDLFQVSNTNLDKKKPEIKPVINEEFKSKLRLLGVDAEEYTCEECSKVFNNHKKLYLHLRQHNKTSICPLDACGKSFSTKGDLEKHMRIHTGEKPFKCDICDKSFTQRASLKNHREKVHNVYRYK